MHENGHLLGAQHDEIEDNKNLGDKMCAGTGIMTAQMDPEPIDKRPSTWSSCSKLRFQRWFNSKQFHYGDCLTIITNGKILHQCTILRNTFNKF